jgi:cytochrome P450
MADDARPTPPPLPPADRGEDFESMGPETFDSPHAQFRALRETCPVAWSNGWGGFWALTKYQDIIDVLSDPKTFTTTIQNVVPRVATSRRRPPLHLDPPDHTPYRRAIAPLFREARMAAWEPAVRRMAADLFAPVLARGEADICREFSYRLPIYVLAEFFNIPGAQADQVRDIGSVYNIALQERNDALVQATSEQLYGIAKSIIELRKREPLDPENDPTSALLAARHEGQPLPEEMILGTIRQMLVVGIIAPTTAIGSMMVHLARHPELQDFLRANPHRIGDAVEELLRLYTPYRGFARTARKDVEIGGRCIREGEAIALVFTSANRDADKFENPDEFDIDRPVRDHITFGRGTHNCPGAGLGRLQIRAALEEILGRTKGFEIAGDIEMTRWPEYGPLTVPMRFW